MCVEKLEQLAIWNWGGGGSRWLMTNLFLVTSGNGGNHFLSFTVHMELEYLFQNHVAIEIITMSIQLGGTNCMSFLLDTIIH